MDEQNLIYVRGAIEALLFVSDKPVTLEQFKEVLGDVDGKTVRSAIDELKGLYDEQRRGMNIMEIAGGYQLLSNSDYAQAIRDFYKTQKKEKLSKPALETLAIIAYKQPVTRLDIELIRGVNSDGVVNHLLTKDLIKIAGRKDVPGKPYLYGITKRFLEYFGLKSLNDLPKLEEFISMDDEKGDEKIEAFQKVSEEFKEKAVVDLLDKTPEEIEKEALEVDRQSAEVEQQSAEVEQQSAEVEQQSAEVEQQSAEVEQQSAEVEQQSAEVEQQSLEIENIQTENLDEQKKDSLQEQTQVASASKEAVENGGTDEHPQIT